MSDSASTDPRVRRLETVSAVVIGVATVLGAVAALFSSLWAGDSAQGAQKAIFQLSQANTQYLDALHQKSDLDFLDFKDDYLYLEMKKALRTKDETEADYIISKMSPDQADAMNAGTTADQSKALDAYDKMMSDRSKAADKLLTDAVAEGKKTEGLMAQSARSNEAGDRFTLTVVLYTLVLFFAGLSNLFREYRMRRLFVAIGVAVLVVTTAFGLFLPIPPLPL